MPSCNKRDLERFLSQLRNYDAIFYKSLSRNDHHWADSRESHQSGLLIPRQYYNFFGFSQKPEENTTRELNFDWFMGGKIYDRSDMPRTGGCNKSRVKYFCEGNRANRPEIHLTCVYNPYFEDLQDGSLLLIGRKKADSGEETEYQSIIIGSEKENLLNRVRQFIDVPEGGTWGLVGAALIAEDAYIQEITEDLFRDLRNMAQEKYRETGGLPKTKYTASKVWNILPKHPDAVKSMVSGSGIKNSNRPFEIAVETYPGNLTRWALQKVEFQFVKFFETEHYPPQFVGSIQENWGPKAPSSWSELEKAFGLALDDVVEVSKSLSQSRVSRAGNSFEQHISKLLNRLGIDYEPQSGDRRIDFRIQNGIDLSAKTSTRERWKEVHEGSYFITLDREVNKDKLDKIRERNIDLVVPETDKKNITHYSEDNGVMSFRDFLTGVQKGRIQ